MICSRLAAILALSVFGINAGATPSLEELVNDSEVAVVGTVVHRFGLTTESHTGFRYIVTMNIVEIEKVVYGSVRAIEHDERSYLRLIHSGGTLEDGTHMDSSRAPDLPVGTRLIGLLVADPNGGGDYFAERSIWELFKVSTSGKEETVESIVTPRAKDLARQRGDAIVAEPPCSFRRLVSDLSEIGLQGGKVVPEIVPEERDERFPDLFPLPERRHQVAEETLPID